MSEKCVKLSKRLQMLADMVTQGNSVADVGCDHGFLSVYLVQSGQSPRALAMDVRQGPLMAAKEHIETWGLEDYIALRLSDGLKEFGIGEAETIVCAGMGGKLMEKILTESLEKAKSVRELVLQPQSELREFRMFLREKGFFVSREEAVFEEGKFYFAMKAAYREREAEKPAECSGREQLLYDSFGERLLMRRHPVLKEYINRRLTAVEEVAETLASGNTERTAARRRELEQELVLLKSALTYFQEQDREQIQG